jgi:hypothetical protein
LGSTSGQLRASVASVVGRLGPDGWVEFPIRRDKFVAHLDEEPTMVIPFMRPARNSVSYLYDFLRDDPATKGFLPDANKSALELYRFWYQHAYFEYSLGSRSPQPA